MKVYYDTEFLEDGKTIDLISVGMVAEDGRELYFVNRDADWARIGQHDWLMANVVPYLPPLDDPRVKRKTEIADEVRRFLLGPLSAPELWAWYGAYDHVVLAQLFGRMIDLPSGIPMWTNDLRQEVHRRGNPPMPEQSAGVHNALADARHVKVMAEYLAAEAADRD
jgi:hypothetical protein